MNQEMSEKISKHIISAIFFVLCFCTYTYFVVSCTSDRIKENLWYCGKLGRVLTDPERIRFAVEFELAKLKTRPQYSEIKYESKEDFFSLNPDCCRVNAINDMNSENRGYFSVQLVEVILHYIAWHDSKRAMNITHVYIGNCGRVVESHGPALSSQEYK